MLLFRPGAAEVHQKAGEWFKDGEIYESVRRELWFSRTFDDPGVANRHSGPRFPGNSRSSSNRKRAAFIKSAGEPDSRTVSGYRNLLALPS